MNKKADCWWINDPEVGYNDENGHYQEYTKEQIAERKRKEIADEIIEEKRRQIIKELGESINSKLEEEIKKLPKGWTLTFDAEFSANPPKKAFWFKKKPTREIVLDKLRKDKSLQDLAAGEVMRAIGGRLQSGRDWVRKYLIGEVPENIAKIIEQNIINEPILASERIIAEILKTSQCSCGGDCKCQGNCKGECPDCQCDMSEEVAEGNVWGY